jgi:hypothetical protein
MIDFELEARRFCEERGLDRVAPIARDAIIRGYELGTQDAQARVHGLREDLAKAHQTSLPDHGQKSGTLQVNPNGTH